MNIVLGDDNLIDIADKYTVLSLDEFRLPGQDKPVRAYCLVEHMPIGDMSYVKNLRDLHENLMQNYACKNWNFCEQALEHLIGKWNNELDTFYHELSNRIRELKNHYVGPDWSPIIQC